MLRLKRRGDTVRPSALRADNIRPYEKSAKQQMDSCQNHKKTETSWKKRESIKNEQAGLGARPQRGVGQSSTVLGRDCYE